MARLLNELEPTGTRWNAPSEDYPQGSFKNGSGEGLRDGSYCKAEWVNDIYGFLGALLKNGGITPNGETDTARNSQIYTALLKVVDEKTATIGGDAVAQASGSANAITATFDKPISLTNGKRVLLRATQANTSSSVTFAPNGLSAKSIVKGNNLPLEAGDIMGEGFWVELIYDSSLDKWVLQNPPTAESESVTALENAIIGLGGTLPEK